METRGAGAARWTSVEAAVLAIGASMLLFAPATARPAGLRPLSSGAGAGECRDGLRPHGLLRDFALGREWAVFASCAHPEMPPVATLASESRTGIGPIPVVRGPAAAVVRPGGSVRLWRQTPAARIDLSGMALDAGAAGASIRVRLVPGGAVLRGIVRAAGSVELEPAVGGFAGAKP